MLRNNAFHSTYLANRVGHATITPTDACEAGSFASFTLTYTAGYFGIDDTGALKIVHRFASDMGRLQFTDPKGWNYMTVEASNGAVLEAALRSRRATSGPGTRRSSIRVSARLPARGRHDHHPLRRSRAGLARHPHADLLRADFEFRVLVDAFATYNYVELPVQPTIPIVAGPAGAVQGVLPTLRRVGEPFRARLQGRGQVGQSQPTSSQGTLHARADAPGRRTAGERRRCAPGELCDAACEGLRCDEPGELHHDACTTTGARCCAGPIRCALRRRRWRCVPLLGRPARPVRGDHRHQLRARADRVRPRPGLPRRHGPPGQRLPDHHAVLGRAQPADRRVQQATAASSSFPATNGRATPALGGDRNVMFRHEGRQIHRSHHALVEDLSDVATDANSAAELFEALKAEDCVVFAHIGGRYADIKMAHDARIERAVEVHSDWGTFEWLLRGRLRAGLPRRHRSPTRTATRAGHGASHPGASLFGAYGGLTCLLATELTRDALFDACAAATTTPRPETACAPRYARALRPAGASCTATTRTWAARVVGAVRAAHDGRHPAQRRRHA